MVSESLENLDVIVNYFLLTFYKLQPHTSLCDIIASVKRVYFAVLDRWRPHPAAQGRHEATESVKVHQQKSQEQSRVVKTDARSCRGKLFNGRSPNKTQSCFPTYG